MNNRLVALLGNVAVLAACSRSAAPSPAQGIVPLVAGPPGAYTSISVAAAGRSADVPAALAATIVPLVPARTFMPADDAGQYRIAGGPRLVYDGPAGVIIVTFGATTFDHHFVYVQRSGQPEIGTLPASVASPILALVGVRLPPPPT